MHAGFCLAASSLGILRQANSLVLFEPGGGVAENHPAAGAGGFEGAGKVFLALHFVMIVMNVEYC